MLHCPTIWDPLSRFAAMVMVSAVSGRGLLTVRIDNGDDLHAFLS